MSLSSTPRDTTTVVRTEIIEVDMTPRGMDMMSDEDEDINITTEYLPTEVITKTITIEGDSTELTEEEIQQLLSQAPEEMNNMESITSTEVVRVSCIFNSKSFFPFRAEKITSFIRNTFNIVCHRMTTTFKLSCPISYCWWLNLIYSYYWFCKHKF